MEKDYNKLLDSRDEIEQRNEAFQKNENSLKLHFDTVQ